MTNEYYIALNLELAKALKMPIEYSTNNGLMFLNDKAFIFDLMIDMDIKPTFNSTLVGASFQGKFCINEDSSFHNEDISLALRVAIAKAVIAKLKAEK